MNINEVDHVSSVYSFNLLLIGNPKYLQKAYYAI